MNIVILALSETVTNIGQLHPKELKALERAVKHGVLIKGKGGAYPLLKTVYARPGFDFAAQRRELVAVMLRARMVDMARGTAQYFPMPCFQEVQS